MKYSFLRLSLLLAVISCQSTAPPAPPPETINPESRTKIISGTGPEEDYHVVPVFFATDRAREPGTTPAKRFGSRRNAQLTYGKIEVSIPREHRLGVIETPSLWRLELRADPARHVVVLRCDEQDQASFFAGLRGAVATGTIRISVCEAR